MTSDLSELSDISNPEVASQASSQIAARGEGQAQLMFKAIIKSAFAADAQESAVGLTVRKEEVVPFGEQFDTAAEAALSRDQLEEGARLVSGQSLPDTSPDEVSARAGAESAQRSSGSQRQDQSLLERMHFEKVGPAGGEQPAGTSTSGRGPCGIESRAALERGEGQAAHCQEQA